MVGYTSVTTSTLGPGDSIFKLFGDTRAETEAVVEAPASEPVQESAVDAVRADAPQALAQASAPEAAVDTGHRTGTTGSETEVIQCLIQLLTEPPGLAPLDASDTAGCSIVYRCSLRLLLQRISSLW